MKIAYLVNTYPSPSQTFIRREIQALERQGWQITRFAMRSNRKGLVDPADIAEDGRTTHVLEQGIKGLAASALGWMLRHPARTLRAAWLALGCGAAGAGTVGGRLRHMIYLVEAAHIARACHEARIPHLHAHFGTNSTTVAMLSHALGGPSYSFTVHGPEEFDAPIALSLGTKIRNAAFSVAISSFGKSQLCRWVGAEEWPRLHVVHCGIEPWRFPAPTPMPKDGLRLVAIGRFVEQKGFLLLIDAMQDAVASNPNIHLTLIGDGPLFSAVKERIAAKALQNHITLTGILDEARIRDTLGDVHALVLPSFAEGLPMVIMEAFAAGRPVIATTIAGIPELVTPETGWLVPAGDKARLTEAILHLGQTPVTTLERMGAAARERVLARHDIDTEAEKLTALFASRGRP